MVVQMTFAQNRTVSGTVRNKANGELLTGVTIVQKGTSHGVITDADGKYSFSIPQDAILVFSFTRYVNKRDQIRQIYSDKC